ncbi:MAG: membrane protein [Lysobacteraceae bacterium]|nr:MAG: membrane protein [Xanthomonadaceae bacterium]
MSQLRWVLAASLLAILSILTVVSIGRIQFVYDLAAFLPPPSSSDQRVLIERLGQTPGSNYLIVGSSNQAALERLSEALSQSSLFTRVSSDVPDDLTALQQGVAYDARFLLNDMDWTQSGLDRALAARAGELALFADTDLIRWVGADPALVGLAWWEQQFDAPDVPWVTEDGTFLLLAETVHPAFDLASQQQAVDQIVDHSLRIGIDDLEISGVGAFGVQLRQTIEAEATFRSVVASMALVAVLFFAYRRWKLVILAALPLLCASAAGFVVLGFVYGEVHGITLAFGFTLLGVTIDFPLHLFSHSRRQAAGLASRTIRSTMLLGAASTTVAYLAIAMGGAPGLGQLGLFAATGIIVAALTSLFILPALLDEKAEVARSSAESVSMRFGLVVVVLVVAVTALFASAQWNNDLSTLSPVPKQALERDQAFREVLGAPSVRYLIAVEGHSEQVTVEETALVADRLRELVEHGGLAGFRSGLGLVPPIAEQRRRQQQIPTESSLRHRLAAAAKENGLTAMQFEPFIAQAVATKSMPLVTVSSYVSTPLEGMVEQFFYHGGDDRFVSLTHLTGEVPADLNHLLDGTSAQVVDLKSASEGLVADYRRQLLMMLGGSLVLIAVLLLVGTSAFRGIWVLSTTLATMSVTALALSGLYGALNLYHLIGVLLIGGLALDYALFLSRPGTSATIADSRHAVAACAASTFVAFSILGLSEIPALQHLGSAVAVGVSFGFALARLSIRPLVGGRR